MQPKSNPERGKLSSRATPVLLHAHTLCSLHGLIRINPAAGSCRKTVRAVTSCRFTVPVSNPQWVNTPCTRAAHTHHAAALNLTTDRQHGLYHTFLSNAEMHRHL